MSERGAGALFIAHVNAKEGNSIEMVFMNTQKKTFPERPRKEMRKSSKAKKFLSLPHSSVRLTWKKPFQ